MYQIVAGLLLLGAVCGATIRFMPFVVVLVLAAIIGVISGLLRNDGAILVDVVLAVGALQVGYVAGIVGRALLRPGRSGRHAITGQRTDRHGLPTQEKPH